MSHSGRATGRGRAAPAVAGGLVRGLALAAAACAVALLIPASLRYDLMAALLALASGVYVGFASGSPAGERRLQWAAALAFTGAGLAGAWAWPPALAAAWAAHGAWDLWHHRSRRPIRVLSGYPALCLAFDLAVAVFVLVHWRLAG